MCPLHTPKYMPFESYSIADDENELKKQFLFSL